MTITYELRTRRGACRHVYDSEASAWAAKDEAERRVGIPFELVRVELHRIEKILNNPLKGE